MSDTKSSYRQIMKATSIFGGVQVFNIFINVIRSKFIAVLLGPFGIGVLGLITATTALIASIVNFGLDTIAVNYIAEAYGTQNLTRISIIVSVFRRIIWIIGFLGFASTFILAPWLSQINFGNNEYTWAFLWISITLLINQLSAGHAILLQGTRQVKYLAKAGLIGSLVGLLTTIPLYYLLGINGIVPAIILTTFLTWVINWHFSAKINIKPSIVSLRYTIVEGKRMLKMGFLISLSGMITLGTSYIIRIYISKSGGVEQVGLYNAGFTILNTYVGLIFTAMATDYYPRLSAVAKSNERCKDVINHQAEIALLIIAPIILTSIVFVNSVLILLYSELFIQLKGMILYASLGLLFKAITWAIGFIFLAKRESKVFFVSEVISNAFLLLLSILGYKYFGLTGLGMSFLMSYIFSLFQVYLIAKVKYGFTFSNSFLKIFIVQLLLAISCFLVVKLFEGFFSYIYGSLFIISSSYFTFRELDKRLDISDILSSLKNKL